MDKTQQYEPLLAEDAKVAAASSSEDDALHFNNPDASTQYVVVISRRARTALFVSIVVQALLISLLIGMLLMKPMHQLEAAASSSECPINHYPQTLYSPAQDAIENVHKVFSMGFGKTKTIYQGDPSPEVDQAWLDLYNSFGLSKIPKSQARLLPNKTLAIPGDEDNYAVGLSVFHQLHCLNLLRQGLRADHYADPVTGAISGILPEDWDDHASHCLDNLRQSVMCASDISLVVWQWVEEANRASISMNTIHSCRNFDKIVDWAKKHRRTTHFDMDVHVEDDIEIPLII
ncbi:hypothetical protein BXZ70DRAFT_590700 [Cristinia sonorae]|uniref:Uncharacterized protein n=1 Tax=Cristinia sonorae TaxID=1940300 RepID=A0A8K0UWC6_9AGAR|nr:hypothetical protein BXZ70DRAFT_590700 [Cristinia sonorae]